MPKLRLIVEDLPNGERFGVLHSLPSGAIVEVKTVPRPTPGSNFCDLCADEFDAGDPVVSLRGARLCSACERRCA